MNVKKLSIATICGLVATMVASIVPIMLYYQPHSEALAKKYPNVVNATPDMVPALIGMIIYLFITALIFDRMGVKSIKEGAITGIWFGGGLWIFFNMQMMALIPGIFDLSYALIDVPVSAVLYSVQGAAIGWALERFE